MWSTNGLLSLVISAIMAKRNVQPALPLVTVKACGTNNEYTTRNVKVRNKNDGILNKSLENANSACNGEHKLIL